jgi:lysozyme family protein
MVARSDWPLLGTRKGEAYSRAALPPEDRMNAERRRTAVGSSVFSLAGVGEIDMAAGNFEKALSLVLVHEGGFSDDKHDPGGRTFQGIIQTEYDTYRRSKGLPLRDVIKLEPAERDEIYRGNYWDPSRADALPAGLDYVVFDGAVNSGLSRSVKWLQRALGSVPIDGHLGPITLAAVGQCADLHRLIETACEARREFLRALSILPYFPGLLIRVDDVQRTALAWASGAEPPPAAKPEKPAAKALQTTAKSAPATATGDVLAAASGGALVTGVAVQSQVVAVAPPAETQHPAEAKPPAAQAIAAPAAKQVAVPATSAVPKTKPGITVQPPQPYLTVTENQTYAIFGALGLLVILGLFLSWSARKARARRADALGENPIAKVALKLPEKLTSGAETAELVPLVKNVYARFLSYAWIGVTIVINVIVLAKLLQGFGLAYENWHEPFLWLGRTYDSYAGQAFTAISAAASQNYGIAPPHWLMPAFILYVSMASAFVVGSTGVMRRDTSAESIWGAVVHAGWLLALPAFVWDAIRYRVVTRFARQNTALFFAYLGLFVAVYVGARFVNDDILPGLSGQPIAQVAAALPLDKLK